MDSFELAYNRSLHFLSYRPRSIKELRDNLAKKKIDTRVIDRVVKKLEEQKFLNDEEFTRFWVRQRTMFRLKSKRVMQLELIKKGISRDMIDTVLGEVIEDVGKVNDLDQAKRIVEKKIDKLRTLDKQEIYKKLGGQLARRGFDWETIKQSIDSELGRS